MSKEKNTKTKYEIIQLAAELFFKKGYSATSPKTIAGELQISPGNLTYYFPTKEHLLAVIVEMLCDFQWNLIEIEAEKGLESITSICIEFMTVAAACQENEIAKDFFTAVYQSELCRDYLRYNHIQRAKRILVEQCSGWSEEAFVIAELMIMGIKHSIITADDSIIPLKERISGALNQILIIYEVEEEIRHKEIDNILHMDCRSLGKKVLSEFIKYVEETNKQALENMLSQKRKNI